MSQKNDLPIRLTPEKMYFIKRKLIPFLKKMGEKEINIGNNYKNMTTDCILDLEYWCSTGYYHDDNRFNISKDSLNKLRELYIKETYK